MTTIAENSNDILNDLIKINNDRIEGYLKAEKESGDNNLDLVEIFQRMAKQSNNNINAIKSLLSKQGGAIVTGTTAMGKIYRTWMDLQMTFSIDDRKNILNACEFGEDAAQAAYEKALEEFNLTEETRALIASQKKELKTSHDLIKMYRNKAVATH